MPWVVVATVLVAVSAARVSVALARAGGVLASVASVMSAEVLAVRVAAPVPAVLAVAAEGFGQLQELLLSSFPGWACPGSRHAGAWGGPGAPFAPSTRRCPSRVPHSE